MDAWVKGVIKLLEPWWKVVFSATARVAAWRRMVPGRARALHPLGPRMRRAMDRRLHHPMRLSLIGAALVAIVAVLVAPGLRLARADDPGAASETPVEPAELTIFVGQYKHSSRGGELPGAESVEVARCADGTLVVRGQLLGKRYTAESRAGLAMDAYRVVEPASEASTGYSIVQEMEDGVVCVTRRGVREDLDGKELSVPAGAVFDPNSRPDPYVTAQAVLRRLELQVGEEKKLQVYDWDSTGEGMATYTVVFRHLGKTSVTVPAGTFEANHIILEQTTSADTWFKKRAGHVTEFWVRDDGIIARILRHREPYDVQLLSVGEAGLGATARDTGALEQGEGTPEQAPATATVSGRVTDRAGAPLSGVLVRARAREGSEVSQGEARTGEDGSYTVSGLTPNRKHRLTYEREGYCFIVDWRDVPAGDSVGVDIELRPAIPFSGRVRDTTGRPIAGVSLELVPTAYDAQGLAYSEGETDAEGRFVCLNASAGSYWLKVIQPQPSADRSSQQLALEQPLVLVDGRPLENHEVVIRPPQDAVIMGRVVDGAGNPAAGVVVDSFIPHDRHWWTRTDGEGRFALVSLNGIGRDPLDVYFNEAPSKAYAGSYKLVYRGVPIGARDVDLVLADPRRIRGRLVPVAGEALPEVSLTVPYILLGDASRMLFEPQVAVDYDGTTGTFEIGDAAVGTVCIAVKLPDGRLQYEEVEARADGTPVVDIPLRPACLLEVKATVTDTRGSVARCSAEAIRKDPVQSMGWFNTDDQGLFLIDTLPAGEYLFRLVHQRQGEWYRTYDVTLRHGETTRLDGAVGGTGAIAGTVTFPAHYPGVRIILREPGLGSLPDLWADRPTPQDRALTVWAVRESGTEYRMINVPAGTWELVAVAEASERTVGYDVRPHAVRAVTIADGDSLAIDFDLASAQAYS